MNDLEFNMKKFIAFDLETPNYLNDRICSIGISIIENSVIVESKYFLVNPECEFSYRNINIHNIKQSDVACAPTFPEVWRNIRNCFLSSSVVAHNALFDLCVLSKTLQAYEIHESPVSFFDTLSIARSTIDDIPNHKLPTLCEYFSITLDHHNALSDCIACARLFCTFTDNGIDIDDFERTFDLACPHSKKLVNTKQKFSESNQSLNMLGDILERITSDGVLESSEINILCEWLDNNKELRGNYPYDKVYDIVENALEDGIIKNCELCNMLELFKHIHDPVIKNLCDCSSVKIDGMYICLSGDFSYGCKADVEKLLSLRGAIIQSNVNKSTNILIVGEYGSSAWISGNYGTKIKRALELQEKGINIQLYKESDFFKILEDKLNGTTSI